MNNSPAFQFYPKDFLAELDVDDLTMRERGIYITLLCHCWLQDGLKGGSRLVRKCFKQAPAVEALFYERDGVFRHRRLDKELQRQEEWRKKSQEGGLHSAEIKRLTKSVKGGSRVVQPMANTPSPSSSPNINNPPTPLFKRGGHRKYQSKPPENPRIGINTKAKSGRDQEFEKWSASLGRRPTAEESQKWWEQKSQP